MGKALTNRREFTVAGLDPQTVNRLVYGSVVPRPIAWVGTVGATGAPNLAPFSFFNVVSSRPPMVMFSTSLRNGDAKDTLANIREVPEFTVSLATDSLARAVNATSEELPRGVSEFEVAGLTPLVLASSRAPAVAESPVVLECIVHSEIDLSEDYPIDGYVMTIGRVVRFHIDAEYLDDAGRIDQARLGAIARMGGPVFARTTDRFEMERP